MRRVYKIKVGDDVCYSTRIVDVFIFLKRHLFANFEDVYFLCDVEVHNLKKVCSCDKIDEYVKSLPGSMKNFSGCNAGLRCRGLGE